MLILKGGDTIHIPRRVLYVQHTADLYGASRALLHLIESLDRAAFTPLVALPAPGPLAQRLRALDVETIVAPHLRVLWSHTLRSWRIVPFGLELLPSALMLRRLIRRHRAAIVHSNTWTIVSGALGARLAGVPHVWHIREILPDRGGLKPLLVSFTLRNACRLLCISEAVAAQFAGRPHAGRVRVIYDGLPPARIVAGSAAASALRERLGLDPGERAIGIVGRLHPQKGQADMLRAYALLRPELRDSTRLLVVGDVSPGHEALRAELEALARQLGVADRVRFLGFLEDVRSLIAAFDALVLPATRPEGLGGVLLEAMAAQVPVIATRAGGPAEVIDDGASGILVPPRQPEALARALDRLLNDSQLGRRLGAAGRSVIDRRFSAARMATQIQAIYREIATEYLLTLA